MNWQTTQKHLEITEEVGHPCTLPGAVGAALGIAGFDFSADELYLAAAVCSHMHPITPSAAGPEATMIRALVCNHVDDTSADFAILSSADGFKDFVKSYFAGTVATGLAYLAMDRSGYNWAGHFEHLKPHGTTGRTPDFVFAAEGRGFCLMESKGTRSNARAYFNNTVEAGYLGQVERHLGNRLRNGVIASHGYCIGSWMTSISKAELLVHHTSAGQHGGGGGGAGQPDLGDPDGGGGLAAIQRLDYATAFTLVFGPSFGNLLRRGAVEDLPALVRVRWLDRNWITRLWPFARGFQSEDGKVQLRYDLGYPPFGFALEENNLRAILGHFTRERGDLERIRGLESLSNDLLARARQEDAGALLTNGLAFIQRDMTKVTSVRWDRQKRDLID